MIISIFKNKDSITEEIGLLFAKANEAREKGDKENFFMYSYKATKVLRDWIAEQNKVYNLTNNKAI